MASLIRVGDRGLTRGPLKPTGQIRVGNESLNATSGGEWIDGDTEIEIIGGSEDRVLVRPLLGNPTQLSNHGQPLDVRQQESPESLEAPPAWVERINPIRIGATAGAIIGLVIWIRGEPLSYSALSLPLAGAACGEMFRRLVAIAAEAAGPRGDHRPLAGMIAFGVCFATILGAIIGLSVTGTFLGVSLGLIGGTITAGIVIALLLLFAHI